MSVPAKGETRVPFQVADSFVLALDDFMNRTRQGAHVSQSVLELSGPPNLGKLRLAAQRLLQKHPLLVASPRRSWKNFLPYWSVPTPPAGGSLPLNLWREEGANGEMPGARAIADAKEFLQAEMMEPFPTIGDLPCNARLDVVLRRDGTSLVALSWSHLLLDGKGAELLFEEIGRLCDGVDLPDDTAMSAKSPVSLWQKFRKTKPAMDHLTGLQKTGTPSLGGPRPRGGRGFYEILAFDSAQSAAIQTRMEKLGGGLFPLAFFVACVARAHDRVFRHRGRSPEGYGISVPTQTRKRGARGPLFHNHVAVLYFHPVREHLESLPKATEAMRAQFASMMRAKISESFDAVLDLMRRAPSRLFLWIIRAQFRGEICSCFHSYTGPFAPGLAQFAGAPITNAYHLPCLGTPPGTGIFFGERDNRLNVTLSWREGALTDEEKELVIAQLRADLLGESEP